MNQDNLLKSLNALRKEGRSAEALSQLRDALRRGLLDAEGIDRAGRFIRREFEAGRIEGKPLKILILGQCTTTWLVSTLTAIAWGHGVTVIVTEGGYDTILHDLSRLDASSDNRPDVVVLVPWSARLIHGTEPLSERIDGEIAVWKQAWSLVSGRFGSRLIQTGYDWVSAGPLGNHLATRREAGAVRAVRSMNEALLQSLPADAYFIDLDQLSGTTGRNTFYDMRRYHWTKQPFSEAGLVALAEHVWAGVRALTTGPKKVLVLDLDNTLWGGVVGETGPLGVALGESPDGEAYLAFQKYVKGLAKRGVVLAVASKNNAADAREPFETNPEMILKLDDIAAFEASWEPKGLTIARIAQTLNLGIDSFVFFDDNPAEREQVRQALAEVAIVEAPEDPAEYARALERGLWFEAVNLTEADSERAEQYTVERKRRELQEAFTSMDDYLKSLDMTAEIRTIDAAEMQRVVQLLAKTNQFNLTTRRHTREDVERLLSDERSIGMTVRVRDRFGDYGLIAVVIAVPDSTSEPETVRIDTWLMSCRVIGRTVEQFTLAALMNRASDLGYKRIVGEFIPTKKNALVANLYLDLGFSPLPDRGDGIVRGELDLSRAEPPGHFISEKSRAEVGGDN